MATIRPSDDSHISGSELVLLGFRSQSARLRPGHKETGRFPDMAADDQPGEACRAAPYGACL